MTVLEVDGLRKAFGGVQAVHEVSFRLAAGELLALIGPNGAGKTTCFNCLNGQLRPDAGSVRLRGRELVGLPPRRVARLGVGRTFQITRTFASMTVIENVQQALLARHGRTRSIWATAERLYSEEAAALLAGVEMADQAGRACAVLAYGDLKRVELAIALAQQPVLLLMDEPTAGMAARERVELMALIRSIVRAQDLAALFTEHDMDVVFGHADRIMVMNRGELVAEGSPEQVRADPLVQEVYLGAGSLRSVAAAPRAARHA
ncbi:MAG TPA: ABC transporter ATP-binding protein [Geminicoccaceae bacterium]|nr:ABC transporter ATP-binding protein [Geminicoccaceae bacterium]